jgi:cell division protein FtsN
MNKFLIGLVFGIIIAGGIAIYLNGSQLRFIKDISFRDNKPNNSNSILAIKPGSSLKIDTSNTNASTPINYDFYQVLQGSPTTRSKSQSATINNNQPTNHVALNYYIQVGAFSDISRAKNLQAQILLLGINVNFKQVTLNNKTIYRLFIGPISDSKQANVILNRLTDNHINAFLTK